MKLTPNEFLLSFESQPIHLAVFDPHYDFNCRLCNKVIETPGHSRTPSKREFSDRLPVVSPRATENQSAVDESNLKRIHRPSKILFENELKITPKRKIRFRKTKYGFTKEVKIVCGNDSIPIESFGETTRLLISVFKCRICQNLPMNPRVLVCGHIYCKECSESWCKESKHCYNSEDEKEHCMSEMTVGLLGMPNAHLTDIFKTIMIECEICHQVKHYTEIGLHLFQCKRKVKKNENQVKDKNDKNLDSVKNEVIKILNSNADKLATTVEQLSLDITCQIMKENGERKLADLIKQTVIAFNNSEKLTPMQTSAIRNFVDMSVGQMNKMSIILSHLEKKKKEKGFLVQLNPFSPYSLYAKEDNKQMPFNVEFTLSTNGNITKSHAGSEQKIPRNILEDYTIFGNQLQEDVRPNILGSYYPVDIVVAKQLSQLEGKLCNQMVNKSINQDAPWIMVQPLTVILKVCQV